MENNLSGLHFDGTGQLPAGLDHDTVSSGIRIDGAPGTRAAGNTEKELWLVDGSGTASPETGWARPTVWSTVGV